MNARSWALVNDDWCKITLRPGQFIEHCQGGGTDEGYSWSVYRWDYDGSYVTRCIRWDTRDCDGRMTGGNEQECPVGLLRSHTIDETPTRLPAWREIERHHRDHTAEAAGY